MTEFERAARDFIASRASPRTREAYSMDLDRWLGFCVASGWNPARPSLAMATAYRESLAGAAPLTVRRMLSTLSSIYKTAMDREKPLASWNPFAPRALPRPPADSFAKTEMVSSERARAVIRSTAAAAASAMTRTSAMGKRDLVILHLLRATGLRRSSVARATRQLIRRGEVHVLRVFVKGGKLGEVELADDVVAAIERWVAVAPLSEWLFPKRGSGPVPVARINEVVADRAKRAGVGHMHPHQFRASFITEALDAGVPLHEVQAAVHHADPRTTQRYDRGARGAGVAASLAKFRGAE